MREVWGANREPGVASASVGPAEIAFIRQTFGLSQRDLARALNVAPYTVARWETGWNEPTGLQEEVLRALHRAAVETAPRTDDSAAKMGGLIALGIGALIFYLLTRNEPVTKTKSATKSTARRRKQQRLRRRA